LLISNLSNLILRYSTQLLSKLFTGD